MVYTTKALRYGAQDAVKKCKLRSKDVWAHVEYETDGQAYARVYIGYKKREIRLEITLSELDVWDRAKVCELVCAQIRRAKDVKNAEFICLGVKNYGRQMPLFDPLRDMQPIYNNSTPDSRNPVKTPDRK